MKKLMYILIAVIVLNGFFITKTYSYSSSDLNNNGILDNTESEVIVDTNQTLPSGEYIFNDLYITNGATLTLEGNPDSLESFKGVKIISNNLTVDFDSSISADKNGYGYLSGLGAPTTLYSDGASYGGAGSGNSTSTIYGSSEIPLDLGSGGVLNGGGAIQLIISNSLINNGSISARGDASGSGGSIYVRTGSLMGSGVFDADGGRLFARGYFWGPGGGGRVAVYYNSSNFSGTVSANGGCGSYDGWSMTCAENGTAGMFDVLGNDLYVNKSWRFQKNDSPINLNHIYLTPNTELKTDEDVIINIATLLLNSRSTLNLSKNDTVNIPSIYLSGESKINLSGEEILNTSLLDLSGGSSVTVAQKKVLKLEIPKISISLDSFISADEKGYDYGTGPGSSPEYTSGASYGGLGYNNIPSSIYGSDLAPIDFGSAGNGRNPNGGGAIRLIVSDTLLNNGRISANGSNTSSGGSVYITTKKLDGTGVIQANGGPSYCPNICLGPGGGGRVAVYYQDNTFTGSIKASGYSGYGGFSENGTVVFESSTPECAVDCFSNVLFIPGLEASRLYEKKTVLGIEVEDQLWEPNFPGEVNKLYLNENGSSLNENIYTKDIIRTGSLFGFFQLDIYKSFEDSMGSLVLENKINDWESFPYDWRQDVQDIVDNGTMYKDGQVVSIIDTLQSLVDSSKNGKVTIISHSNGGLIAKALVKKIGEMKQSGQSDLIDHIDRVILVASPQLGTPSALSGVLHGYKQSIPAGLMTEIQARNLAKNMPSAYGLLPSKKYFDQLGVGYVGIFSSTSPGIYKNIYSSEINNYEEQNNFILGVEGRSEPKETDLINPIKGNELLLEKAENLHDLIDQNVFPDSIKVIDIAGWGKETISGITYTDSDIQPIYTIRGDKTVVVPSALYGQGTKYWLDLSQSKLQHNNILEDSQLLDFIVSTLTQKPPVFSLVTDSEPLQVGDRLHLSVHSPVSIGVHDEYGNFTGKVCDDSGLCNVIEDIPGSTYFEFGEGKYLNLGNGNIQKIELHGTGVGTFTFDLDIVHADKTTTDFSFIDIPVTNLSKAEVVLDQNNIPNIKLDVSGDGVNDFDIEPSNNFDPVTYLQIMKSTINSLDISRNKKEELNKKIDKIIKSIQKNKLKKITEALNKFKQEVNKSMSREDREHSKKGNISKSDAQMLLDMLNKLLDNLS